uniref:Uncharacterized protein n=1 Tax=Physcomitrium patens TaxID=3218 RepID=A0A2K1K8G7_PHYPA|nr:hypothetical protein PHYPA_011966 [Physcomitrium patens]
MRVTTSRGVVDVEALIREKEQYCTKKLCIYAQFLPVEESPVGRVLHHQVHVDEPKIP